MPNASTQAARRQAHRRADAGRRADRSQHGRRMETRIVDPLRRHRGQAAQSPPRRPRCQAADPRPTSRGARMRPARGNDHRAACTGPPSNVSSKSSPWAAVPFTSAASSARNGAGGRWRCTVRPGRARASQPARTVCPRGDAQAGDVEHDFAAISRVRPGARLRTGDDARQPLRNALFFLLAARHARRSAHDLDSRRLQQRAQLVLDLLDRLRELGAAGEAVLELVVVDVFLPRRRCAQLGEEIFPVRRGSAGMPAARPPRGSAASA